MTPPTRGIALDLRLLAYSILCGLLAASAARADSLPLPPRSEWRASSSATETPAMASPFAIDGDPKTRWGGPFAGEHWLQVDLGSVASIGGVKLQWDSGFAASYRILASVDGQEWRTVFETADGQGGIDYVFFSAIDARYLRLAPVPLSADWGVSLFEFEPLSTDETPRVTGMSKDVDPSTLWGGTATPPRTLGPTREIKIVLPRAFETTGLEVWWGAARRRAELEGRDTSGKWHTLSIDREPQGDTSLLAARTPIIATELVLKVGAAAGVVPAIRRLRLLPPDRTMTPLRRYEVVASRVHSELFPLTLRNRQVYWTVVGVPAGRQKSIFDEFGNLEAWKGAPLVQPLWRDADRRVHAVQGSNPIQSLRDGWMPMPTVQWSPQSGLTIRSEAITVEQNGQPITLLRHRLQNTGAKRIEGELTLLVRPLQINPPWQNGGISPIHEIALEGKDVDAAVRVNGRLLLRSLTAVQTRGAAGFGVHGEDELTETLAWGAPPTAAKARDYDGLAAAYLRYTIRLAPGETSDAVVAFPLGNERIDVLAGKLPEAPPIDRAALLAAGAHSVNAPATAAADGGAPPAAANVASTPPA
ncbi:MAG TPA: discoidin domain-containing protein, partial [Polyangiales bacterium]|nr:discoidin domain-containing protein [Polyangiales bacterium]